MMTDTTTVTDPFLDENTGVLMNKRRKSRRSSILKTTSKSPSRDALTDIDPNLETQTLDLTRRDRKSRRVSFADTFQVKEFHEVHHGPEADIPNPIIGLDSLLTGQIQNAVPLEVSQTVCECNQPTEKSEDSIKTSNHAQNKSTLVGPAGVCNLLDENDLETWRNTSVNRETNSPQYKKKVDTRNFLDKLKFGSKMESFPHEAIDSAAKVDTMSFLNRLKSSSASNQTFFQVDDEIDFVLSPNICDNAVSSRPMNPVSSRPMNPVATTIVESHQQEVTDIFDSADMDMTQALNQTIAVRQDADDKTCLFRGDMMTQLGQGQGTDRSHTETSRKVGLHNLDGETKPDLPDSTVVFGKGDNMDMTTAMDLTLAYKMNANDNTYIAVAEHDADVNKTDLNKDSKQDADMEITAVLNPTISFKEKLDDETQIFQSRKENHRGIVKVTESENTTKAIKIEDIQEMTREEESLASCVNMEMTGVLNPTLLIKQSATDKTCTIKASLNECMGNSCGVDGHTSTLRLVTSPCGVTCVQEVNMEMTGVVSHTESTTVSQTKSTTVSHTESTTSEMCTIRQGTTCEVSSPVSQSGVDKIEQSCQKSDDMEMTKALEPTLYVKESLGDLTQTMRSRVSINTGTLPVDQLSDMEMTKALDPTIHVKESLGGLTQTMRSRVSINTGILPADQQSDMEMTKALDPTIHVKESLGGLTQTRREAKSTLPANQWSDMEMTKALDPTLNVKESLGNQTMRDMSINTGILPEQLSDMEMTKALDPTIHVKESLGDQTPSMNRCALISTETLPAHQQIDMQMTEAMDLTLYVKKSVQDTTFAIKDVYVMKRETLDDGGSEMEVSTSRDHTIAVKESTGDHTQMMTQKANALDLEKSLEIGHDHTCSQSPIPEDTKHVDLQKTFTLPAENWESIETLYEDIEDDVYVHTEGSQTVSAVSGEDEMEARLPVGDSTPKDDTYTLETFDAVEKTSLTVEEDQECDLREMGQGNNEVIVERDRSKVSESFGAKTLILNLQGDDYLTKTFIMPHDMSIKQDYLSTSVFGRTTSDTQDLIREAKQACDAVMQAGQLIEQAAGCQQSCTAYKPSLDESMGILGDSLLGEVERNNKQSVSQKRQREEDDEINEAKKQILEQNNQLYIPSNAVLPQTKSAPVSLRDSGIERRMHFSAEAQNYTKHRLDTHRHTSTLMLCGVLEEGAAHSTMLPLLPFIDKKMELSLMSLPAKGKVTLDQFLDFFNVSFIDVTGLGQSRRSTLPPQFEAADPQCLSDCLTLTSIAKPQHHVYQWACEYLTKQTDKFCETAKTVENRMNECSPLIFEEVRGASNDTLKGIRTRITELKKCSKKIAKSTFTDWRCKMVTNLTESFQKEGSALEKMIEGIKEDRLDIEKHLNSVTEDKDDLDKEIAELEAWSIPSEEELKSYADGLDELRQAEDELRIRTEESEALTKQRDELKVEIESAKQEAKELENERSQSVNEANCQYLALKTELNNLKERLTQEERITEYKITNFDDDEVEFKFLMDTLSLTVHFGEDNRNSRDGTTTESASGCDESERDITNIELKCHLDTVKLHVADSWLNLVHRLIVEVLSAQQLRQQFKTKNSLPKLLDKVSAEVMKCYLLGKEVDEISCKRLVTVDNLRLSVKFFSIETKSMFVVHFDLDPRKYPLHPMSKQVDPQIGNLTEVTITKVIEDVQVGMNYLTRIFNELDKLVMGNLT